MYIIKVYLKSWKSSASTAFCNCCKNLSGGGDVQCWRYNFEYSKQCFKAFIRSWKKSFVQTSTFLNFNPII